MIRIFINGDAEPRVFKNTMHREDSSLLMFEYDATGLHKALSGLEGPWKFYVEVSHLPKMRVISSDV